MRLPQEESEVSILRDAITHPITKPMLHNATRSPLVQLPDDILLNIMGHTDDVSLLYLRRTCRTMLRLFSRGMQFRRFHDGRFQQHLPRLYDFQWGLERVPEIAKDALRDLLRKDMYCDLRRGFDVPEKRKRLEEERLYCSGCQTKHSAGLFSYSQRRQAPNSSRICIGREGNIPICQESTISWAEVEAFLNSREPASRYDCQYSTHASIFGQGLCRDHECAVSVTMDKTQTSVPHPHCCKNERSSDGRRGWLNIEWSTHITFPGLGTSQALEYDDVLKRIEWARNAAGGYLFKFQHQHCKFPTELGLFDPKSCRCIRLPDPPPGVPAWKWSRVQTSNSHCRRHRPQRKGEAEQECFTSEMVQRVCHPKPPGTCINYNASLGLLRVDRCERMSTTGPHCFVFDYRKLIPLERKNGKCTQPWSASWFMELDPGSFSLLDDSESLGVYWCKTGRCLNYHGNHPLNRKRRTLDPDQRRHEEETEKVGGSFGAELMALFRFRRR